MRQHSYQLSLNVSKARTPDTLYRSDHLRIAGIFMRDISPGEKLYGGPWKINDDRVFAAICQARTKESDNPSAGLEHPVW
jgi:hypothetical protein